jgi:hypothetical protein
LERLIVSAATPIAEKAAFFIPPFYGEFKKYSKTPKNKREKIKQYMARAMTGTGKNLAWDLVQDAVYLTAINAAMKKWPQAPSWATALVSIGVSVAATTMVMFGEVGINEVGFLSYKQKLKNAGFRQKDYIEARFFIRADKKPEEAFAELKREFELNESDPSSFKDIYFPNKIPNFSNRCPKLRIRTRTSRLESVTSAEVIFNKAYEAVSGRKFDQHRLFPIVKTKLAYASPSEIQNFEQVSDSKARKILIGQRKSPEPTEVSFERRVASNQHLLISLDLIKNKEDAPFYLIEMKTYNKMVGLLENAMRYVMRNFPVLETTYEKEDLVRMGC